MVRLLATIVLCAGALAQASAECSDAGVCRILDAPGAGDGGLLGLGWSAALTAGSERGAAAEDITYRTLRIGVSLALPSGTFLSAELPVVDLDGRRGSGSGLGDAMLAVRQGLPPLLPLGVGSVMLGARLPTGDDAANPDLPQGYQTGLGGTDLLFGVGYGLLGVQADLVYTHAAGANGLPGVHLERGDTLTAGIGYAHELQGWRPSARLLAIQPLERTRVDDGAGGSVEVPGSDRMQVNLRLGCAIPLGSGFELDAVYVQPLLDRDHDADGLTRRASFSLGAGYRW